MNNLNEVGLNQSQHEILQSELAALGSALNTISFRLRLRDFDVFSVEGAVLASLRSADVFTASLTEKDNEWFFITGSVPIAPCTVTDTMTLSDAGHYADRLDYLPLNFPQELYQTHIIPVKEGGVILYIRFHHIIIDGRGMCLLVQNILDFLSEKEILPSHFFTDVPHSSNDSDDVFWRSLFADCDFESAIFHERADGLKKTTYCRNQEESLLPDTRRFTKETGVSLPYVFLAAYAIYIAQATDKKEAVILMPRLARSESEMYTVGCYTLLIPVRITIDPEETFAELCCRLKLLSQEASSHKKIGYSQILRDISEECDLSDALSEYVFNYYSDIIKSKLDYELSISVAGAMRNHLTFNIFLQDNDLTFTYDIHNGIYNDEMVDYFSDSIHLILYEGFRGTKTGQLSIIGKNEKSRLLSVYGRKLVHDRNDTIPSLFRSAANRFCDRPALYSGTQQLTFAELDRLSDRIASSLYTKGVRGGDYVAFLLPRDLRLIPTLLGISKTGAAFIPIDPAYPNERIMYILEDSNARYLISTASVSMTAGRDFLEVDRLMEGTEPFTLPDIPQAQTAYMIYTSGTTGRPKGVMLSHKGIVNIVHPDNNPFSRDITQNATGIVAIGSICFDISLFEIFVPLMNGLFVELGNEKAMLDPVVLADAILQHNADILHCTPSRLAAYLGNEKFSTAIRNIKAILSAGEVLPESLVNQLRDNYGIRIYNGYGPTETTIGATITEAGDNQTIG